MLTRTDFDGNPYIGVLCAASEKLALVPTNSPDEFKESIEKALGVEIIEAQIGGSPLLGSLVCMNSNGAVVANFAADEDIAELKKHLNVVRLTSKQNACGNNILANEKGAAVHPDFKPKYVKLIEETLQVEAEQMTLGDVNTVGTAAVVTRKGFLCHPHASEEELQSLKRIFQVEGNIGTANYGGALVGAGIVANSKGAVCGNHTTPVELGRVEDALRLY